MDLMVIAFNKCCIRFGYGFGGGVDTSYIKPCRIFAVTSATATPKTEILEDKISDMKNVALATFASFVESEFNFWNSTCFHELVQRI